MRTSAATASATQIGEIVGVSLVLALGIALVLAGAVILRRRRSAPASPPPLPGATWTPPPLPPEGEPAFFAGSTVVPGSTTDPSVPSPVFSSPAPPSHGVQQSTAKSSPGAWLMVGLGLLLTVVGGIGLAGRLGDAFNSHTLTLGSTAGGLFQINVPAAQQQLEKTTQDLNQQTSIENPQAAIYGATSDATIPSAMFMGAEIAGRPNQDDFLTGATAGLAQAGLQVTLTDQDPGSYGGKMQCGTAASPQGIPLGLCVWIDDDTFGVIIGFNDNAAKITTLAPAMRADIEN